VKKDVDGIAREFAEGSLTIKNVSLGALKLNVSYPENTSDDPISFLRLVICYQRKSDI
jgi:hypothetical protein